MKLRSLQTNLVSMGQLRSQLQVHCITSALVLGRVPGQSGSKPALCSSRFLMVVVYLPWLLYSGMNLVTRSFIPTKPFSQRCMIQERVAVTLVTEAMSKIVSLLKKGLEWGAWLRVRCPNGWLQTVSLPLDTLRMPPAYAPSMRQLLTTVSTCPQSQSWLERARYASRVIKTSNFIKIYNNQIRSVKPFSMKALSNTQQQATQEAQSSQQINKRLSELHHTNDQKETLISALENEVQGLESTNQALKEEVLKYEQQWQSLREKEEQKSEQEEQEMNEWIESVQKSNGLAQSAIDSLLSIQFEGGQHEICPSCFQELAPGVMCTYLPCAHLFHRDCIVNHLKVNKFCLACQEPVVL